tara:strand:- start:97 stop:792 length:696 start_codon:yes stop_codon:yes gene_type:complete
MKIITYREMCNQEKVETIQRGMNYFLRPNYSVILMSVKKGSPYNDHISVDGRKVVYEGHDVPSHHASIPKMVDQPMHNPSGSLTQNGKFYNAAQNSISGKSRHIVRIYQKMTKGVWVDNYFFSLIDADFAPDEYRNVFKFTLEAINDIPDGSLVGKDDIEDAKAEHTRVIPSHVIQEVWKRDKGQCVICSAEDNLHYDHYLPYSKGGSSVSPENIRILCGRHNLAKSDKIE